MPPAPLLACRSATTSLETPRGCGNCCARECGIRPHVTGSTQPARALVGLAGEGIPVGRFLFGNDLPPVWVALDGPIELLNAMNLPEADLEAIRWKNAARFFVLPLAE